MKKRGQITIFLIIALIIISSIVLFTTNYNIKDKLLLQTTETKIYTIKAEYIKDYVEGCLYAIEPADSLILGIQGGYYQLEEGYTINLGDIDFIIPIYFEDKKSNLPSLSFIESEFSKYIENSLPYCIDDFSSFDKKNFEIIQGEIKANTKLLENKIIININYPIIIKQNKTQVIKLDNFEISKPNNLYSFYNITNKIIENQVKNPYGINLDLLNNLDINSTIIPINEKTFIHILINENNINPEAFMFVSDFK